MPTPVKTFLLRAIKEAIAGVNGIAQVARNPSAPVTRETATFPLVHVWDDEPEVVKPLNRYANCKMSIQIDVYVRAGGEAASDQLDVIQADICTAIMSSPDVKHYGKHVGPDREVSAMKQFIEEDLSAIVLRFDVEYNHLWGDPYTLPKS
jgi:hypothetical protein